MDTTPQRTPESESRPSANEEMLALLRENNALLRRQERSRKIGFYIRMFFILLIAGYFFFMFQFLKGNYPVYKERFEAFTTTFNNTLAILQKVQAPVQIGLTSPSAALENTNAPAPQLADPATVELDPEFIEQVLQALPAELKEQLQPQGAVLER